MTRLKQNAKKKIAPIQQISLNNDQTALVDRRDWFFLRNYAWKAVRKQRSWYAQATMHYYAGPCKIYMHRLIADTPDGQVCHHRNRNSLDNRRANLLNMPPKEHQILHQNDTLLIQFEKTLSQNQECGDCQIPKFHKNTPKQLNKPLPRTTNEP